MSRYIKQVEAVDWEKVSADLGSGHYGMFDIMPELEDYFTTETFSACVLLVYYKTNPKVISKILEFVYEHCILEDTAEGVWFQRYVEFTLQLDLYCSLTFVDRRDN